MVHVVLASEDRSELESLAAELQKDRRNTLHQACSGREVWALVKREKIDVVVVAERLRDGDGFAFVKNFTREHPLINCAMVSSLPPDEFHEATEGLGVFMQLPHRPGSREVERMMRHLATINTLITG